MTEHPSTMTDLRDAEADRYAGLAPLFPADERDDEAGAGYIPDPVTWRTATLDHAGAGTRKRLVTGGNPDAPANLPTLRAFSAPSGETLDYARGTDIERIADALIAQCADLAFLSNVIVRYLWRRKRQAKAGKVILGTCASLSGVPQFALGGGEFLITLNWENCRAAQLRAWQLEALVYHELNHIAPPDDDEPNAAPSLVGHDFEGFASELDRYGMWHPALAVAGAAFGQLGLWGD